MESTPVSLLERLRQAGEQAAWERFVQLYTPLLRHWARRLGLQGADADDVVQDVFAVLVEKLPEFRYDPARRFRGWLWTILANKCRTRRRRPVGWRKPLDEELEALTAPDPAAESDEAEYRQYLTQRALELLQGEFQPATWQAFREFAIAGRPAAEVARELHLSENAVYLAKARVLRRLRRELAGLLD